jgi:hypothetical protein
VKRNVRFVPKYKLTLLTYTIPTVYNEEIVSDFFDVAINLKFCFKCMNVPYDYFIMYIEITTRFLNFSIRYLL